MARKRKPLPLLENITIEAVAAEGKCITRVDEQVIFVPFCVPGDVVDLQVVKKKHKYCEAKVVRCRSHRRSRNDVVHEQAEKTTPRTAKS